MRHSAQCQGLGVSVGQARQHCRLLAPRLQQLLIAVQSSQQLGDVGAGLVQTRGIFSLQLRRCGAADRDLTTIAIPQGQIQAHRRAPGVYRAGVTTAIEA